MTACTSTRIGAAATAAYLELFRERSLRLWLAFSFEKKETGKARVIQIFQHLIFYRTLLSYTLLVRRTLS